MLELKLENITLNLSQKGSNVQIKYNSEKVILINQSIKNVFELTKHNFNIVYNHYKLIVYDVSEEFNLIDINIISINIVMNYLYMYNSWKNIYKKQENRSLKFNNEDFNHPSTYDIIFTYYKKKYPHNWEEKCSKLLAMDLDKLKVYYKNREDYYNK